MLMNEPGPARMFIYGLLVGWVLYIGVLAFFIYGPDIPVRHVFYTDAPYETVRYE